MGRAHGITLPLQQSNLTFNVIFSWINRFEKVFFTFLKARYTGNIFLELASLEHFWTCSFLKGYRLWPNCSTLHSKISRIHCMLWSIGKARYTNYFILYCFYFSLTSTSLCTHLDSTENLTKSKIPKNTLIYFLCNHYDFTRLGLLLIKAHHL